jgi:hypothetical protein
MRAVSQLLGPIPTSMPDGQVYRPLAVAKRHRIRLESGMTKEMDDT